MALDQKFFKKSTAGSGTDQEQGFIAHLDANDVDSYDGDGSIWYDISGHEATVPLVDKASNLQLHLNASDTTSYSGSGSTWTDISGNDRHGTITDPVFESGLAGGLDFNSASDANGDKVAVAHNAAFNQQNNMTFEVWVKRDGTTEDNIFHKGGASGNSYFLTWNPSYGYYFYTYAWAGGVYSGTSGLSTGVYEHVVVTIDGSGNRKMYVNGTLSANNLNGNTTGTGTLTDTGPLTIGGYYTYAAHGGFDGRISVVRIYNTVLTASEVGQNFRAGNNFSYSSTITSKHEATQGTLYSTNLALSLDANGYSSGAWSNTANSSYNATVSGAAHTNDGNSDYFDFDGSNDYAEVSAYAGTDIGSGGFTLEAWCLCDASSGQDTIASNLGPSDTTGYQLYIDAGTGVKLYIYSDSSNYRQLTATSAITQGTWNHCVFTVASASNGAAIKLYVNGIEKDSDTLNSNYTGADHGLDIGRYPYNDTKYFDGKIAQVRTYSAALTTTQITTNYDATKALYQNPSLALDFDPADIDDSASTATWTDKVASVVLTESGTIDYNQELGDFADLEMADYFGNGSATTAIKDANGDFVMDFWVNFNSAMTSYHNVLLGVNQSSGLRGILFYFSAADMQVYIYKNGTHTGSMYGTASWSTLGISTGEWNNLVLRVDHSTDLKYYVNGVLKATYTNSVGGTHWTNLYNIRLGDDGTLSYESNFKIGDFRIYKGLLTEAQIAQNYLARKNKYPTGHHATIVGSPTWGTYNSGGVTYNYFDLNGSSQYMTIPHNTIFDFELPTTLEVWVNKDGTAREWIIEKANGGSGTYSWQLEHSTAASNNFRFQMHNTSNATIECDVSTATNTGTWYHVAVTHDGNNVFKIYLNGSLEDTSTLSGTISKNTSGVTIGKYSLASGYEFDGKIGMVKFHNRTFTDAEVDAAFDSTKSKYGVT